MKKSFTVHDLPLSERPRERLLKLGVEALSAQEILAIIMGRGTAGESVMVTAQNLFSRFGNLKNIAAASIEELTETRGIGIAKATQIKASFELSKRLENSSNDDQKTTVKAPEDAIKAIKNLLKGKKKEHFLVLSLDTRNHLINTQTVSIGSLDSSIVHPREVFKEAISSTAASVIFVHSNRAAHMSHRSHADGSPTHSDREMGPSRARVISIRCIFSGGFASRYPPFEPRWLLTKPAASSDMMICRR